MVLMFQFQVFAKSKNNHILSLPKQNLQQTKQNLREYPKSKMDIYLPVLVKVE